MNGLMLHCGAHAINRAQLAQVPVPPPMGARHVCRPFVEDVELVTEELRSFGLEVVGEAFGLAHQGQRFFGTLELAAPVLEGEYISAKPFALTVGLRGSYDQSFPRGLAVGSRVFVCDNLSFSGDVTINTRQTTNIGERIGPLWRQACEKIPALAEQQEQRFDAYRNRAMAPRAGDAAIIEMVRRGIVTPSQVGRVVAEWDTPSHPEHAEEGHTVWRLFNAVTEAAKPSSADRFSLPQLWERTVNLTGYLDNAIGLH
jgi:hypothetical protein